jgi:hypothetical protein
VDKHFLAYSQIVRYTISCCYAAFNNTLTFFQVTFDLEANNWVFPSLIWAVNHNVGVGFMLRTVWVVRESSVAVAVDNKMPVVLRVLHQIRHYRTGSADTRNQLYFSLLTR